MRLMRQCFTALNMSLPQDQPSQADIFSALQSSSFRPKTAPQTQAFADIGEVGSSSTRNARKFYCFRPECSSVILQKDTAELVNAVTSNLPPHDPASPFPAPTSTTDATFWRVTDCPFAFDNIGLTRPDASAPVKAGKQVKYLICAECDLGPLGWSFEGGSEAWLALDRIRYGPE